MKKLLSILLLPLLFVSCSEDFTVLGPISERNVVNYYKTQSDFEVAINGAFDALQSNGTFGVKYVLFMEMRADNTANGGGATGLAETLEDIDTFGEIPTAGELNDAWVASYDGIARTNAIISRIDEITFTSDEVKNRIKGEALFGDSHKRLLMVPPLGSEKVLILSSQCLHFVFGTAACEQFVSRFVLIRL